jgi:serine/threonine protein kinase
MNEPTDPEVSIYAEALALPARERAAYLDSACVGDPKLRQRIEHLLRVQEKAGTFFEGLERETRPSCSKGAEESGKWIDRYLLVEQIGEGGCGVVYRAEQERPVQRQVALKIIKLGMDTKEVVARFEVERQALALMDHPHIARVLDAGATETGRPYFVMELVRGTKITDYCDQHQFSIVERLDLFIQVCRAIQHAHQKGVIHRDIKPSNILVSVRDEAAFPKVIDFGIAKATQGRLTDQTVFTAVEQFIGTPAYMSPEQAERGRIDIDTRSDIYSLGVLLYELLTGRTPFDSKTLLECSLDVMLQTIREKEPTRPSIRLGTLATEELAAVARYRRIDPTKLITTVRGDLDWIVIKSLEKERSRRYATVNALLQDIERHLANEPVAAHPPSQMDWFRKVIRRNKLAVAASTAVLAALVLGFGVSTLLFLREKEARRLAQAAEEKQVHLRTQAEKEALKSRQLAQSLQDLLQRLGPTVTRDRAELQRILDQLSGTDSTQPESTGLLRMRAYLRGTAGRFAEAGSDAERLLELTPDDGELWHWRAATLLHEGRYDAYRDLCRRSLQRFKDVADPLTAERVVKDSLVLPHSDMDMNAVDAMVNTALNASAWHSEGGWFQLTKGMAEYRKGNFDGALVWLRMINLGRQPYLDAETLLMMAMASQRANHPAEAVAALNQATTVIETQLTRIVDGDVNAFWVDRIIADSLLHEARSVLDGEKVEIQNEQDPRD